MVEEAVKRGSGWSSIYLLDKGGVTIGNVPWNVPCQAAPDIASCNIPIICLTIVILFREKSNQVLFFNNDSYNFKTA